jgi:methylglyoxal synthase
MRRHLGGAASPKGGRVNLERTDKKKTIALVAHDNCKADLVAWVEYNCQILVAHRIVCTGTTGRLVGETLKRKCETEGATLPAGFAILMLKSGPLGGDQQLGAMVAEGKIDVMIFFWDPMEPHPHEVDVKALLRIAVVYNIPIACNRSTADFLISSPLLEQGYDPIQKEYRDYVDRPVRTG